MANSARPGWQPQWAVAPGEILLEALQEREMTQSELALRLGRPLKTVNEIIKGRAAITPETALQLELALGITARFWTNLEIQYRNTLARRQADDLLQSEAGWVDRFPIADLVRHRLIERGSTKASTLANLLSWLGISGPAAFERLSGAAAYRASPAFRASPEAVAAWLRWGELQAAAAEVGPFDARRFRGVLADIRPLTRKEPFAQIFKRVQNMCAEAGVVVVLTPELSGTHLSGATRWLGSKVIIQLSLRYRSDDQFWFTFFHEAGHILVARRGRDFVDGTDVQASERDAEERAANKFARDALLPTDAFHEFIQASNFSLSAVRAFAASQSIASGIVAGRLERDELVRPGQLHSLKRTLTLPGTPPPVRRPR